MKNFILLSLVCLFINGCNKDVPKDNLEEIQQYLTDNNLTANTTASGLHYIITRDGDGNHPNANSDVTVYYKGYFTDDSIFDQRLSPNEPIEFNLQGVISGWTEGIQLLSKGGKGTFLIPASLGYGSSGQGPIPGNSVLLFDVELLSFK